MKTKLMVFALMATFSGWLASPDPASAQITSWQLTTAPTNTWSSVASSANGSNLVAVAQGLAGLFGGPIYTSTNAGATWISNSAPVTNWMSVACSTDGTKLVAVAGAGSAHTVGPIYTSANSGATWTSNSAPITNWMSVASSADGSRLVAVTYGGGIYTNSGTSWAASPISVGGPFPPSWLSVGSSPNGSNLVVGGTALIESLTYFSTNAGTSWTTASVTFSIQSPVFLANGTTVLGLASGSFAISTNAGASWSFLNNSPAIHDLAASTNGACLVGATATASGPIYNSVNYGTNWMTNSTPISTRNMNWKAIASSADGGRLVAAVNPGGIWIGQLLPDLGISVSVNNNTDNATLSWPSLPYIASFALQHNSDLSTANWADVTNSVSLIGGNNQVTLSQTNRQDFYRLIGN